MTSGHASHRYRSTPLHLDTNKLRDLVSWQVGRGAGQIALTRAVSAGLELAVVLTLSRLLGAAEFGLYAWTLSVAAMLAVPTAAGFDRLNVREVSRLVSLGQGDAAARFVTRSRSIVVALAVVLITLAILTTLFSGHRAALGEPGFVSAAAVAALLALTRVNQGALQGIGRVSLGQVAEFVIQPAVLLVMVVAGFSCLGASATGRQAVTLHLGALAVAIVFAWRLASTMLKRKAHAATTPATMVGTDVASMAVFAWVTAMTAIVSNVDVMLVGLLADPASAGVYRTATQFAGLVSLPITAVNLAFAHRITKLYYSDDRESLQREARSSARLMLTLAVAGALVVVLSGSFMLGVIGPEFTAGYWPLVMLVGGHVATATAGSSGYVLLMTRHARDAALTLTVTAALSCCLCLLLIPSFGIFGAAASTLASLTLGALAFSALAWRRLGISASLWTPSR